MQDEEYEDIDLDSSGVPQIPGIGVGVVSPSKRPRMPIPGALQDKLQGGGARIPPVPVQRTQSLRNGPAGLGKSPPPALPPPNRSMPGSLAKQLQGPPLSGRGWPRQQSAGSTSSDSAEYDIPRLGPQVPKRKPRSKTMSYADPNAPPLPPKPIDFKELEESLKPKDKNKESMQDYIIDAEELSLDNFTKKYQDELPLHVRVCKGFYGQSERTSVSEGDTFNVHFIKKAKVVNIMDGCGGSYKVALNSALEFGIMYDPNKNREEALAGFKFSKVSDLFQLPVLPKLLRVTEGWRGSSSDSTVENNELLIVKGLKRRINHKYLKAISLSSKEKKELPESCGAKLSTRPYDVRLYLPDLLDMVDNPLPSTAVLFVSSESAHELPSSMVTSVVKLTSLSTETSLITTSTFVPPDVTGEAPMMDIPEDLDIELQVMWPKSKEDTEQLYADTRTLLENFNPGKISTYISNNKGPENTAQSAVYAIVKEGNEMAGVDLVKPSAIYYNSTEIFPPKRGQSDPPQTLPHDSSTSSSDDRYSTPSTPQASRKSKSPKRAVAAIQDAVFGDLVDAATVSDLEDRIQGLESRLKSLEDTLSQVPNLTKFEKDAVKVSRDITSARADMKRLEGRVVQTAEDFGTAKTEITKMGSSIQEIKEWCGAIEKTLTSLHQAGPGIAPSSHSNGSATLGYMPLRNSPQRDSSSGEQSLYSTVSEEVCQKNREFLGCLDSVQVLTLLDNMGLRKLQENFIAERVNGEILVECDDEVLYQELKVKSKIHRVRLMKVISGRHSAEGILRGEDPYVYASPTQ